MGCHETKELISSFRDCICDHGLVKRAYKVGYIQSYRMSHIECSAVHLHSIDFSRHYFIVADPPILFKSTGCANQKLIA